MNIRRKRLALFYKAFFLNKWTDLWSAVVGCGQSESLGGGGGHTSGSLVGSSKADKRSDEPI